MSTTENAIEFNKDAWAKEVQNAVQKQRYEEDEQKEDKEIEIDDPNLSDGDSVADESGDNDSDSYYELSDSDLKAMQLGWKPEHLYKGDKSKWKPSKEWLAFKPAEETFSLKKKNAVLEQKTQYLEQELDKLKKHILDSGERQLLKQKRERIEFGDADEVAATEKELADLYDRFYSQNNSNEQQIPQQTRDYVNKFANDFVSRNNHWLTNQSDPDAIMAAKMVRELDNHYFQWGVTDPETHFEFLEATLRKRFPELNIGGTDKKRYQNKVTPIRSTAPTDRKRVYTVSDLSEIQRHVMRGLISNGSVTEKEYIDYLVKEGELK